MRLALAFALFGGVAEASTVMELSPAALEDGADRIVEGTVVSAESRWTADHANLETHAIIEIEATRKGEPGLRVEVVTAGGELGDVRQIVFGMPAVDVGDHARWFLKPRGDGTYRVYGWSQGKWPARMEQGVLRFARDPIAAERGQLRFKTNGMVWPTMPVPYLINSTGSADLAIGDVVAAFDAAFATWQDVPTAGLTFVNGGMTSLGQVIDGTNVMLFIESGWAFGSEAAAATSLMIMPGMQTADIAMNGENWTWAVGPPSTGINSKTLDLQAVATHEIGHFSGLDHSEHAADTMYFSWDPWPGQRTLSIDDKLGLTSIYPVAGNECSGDGDCDIANGETCRDVAQGTLCGADPEPVGSPCNYDRVECDGFCLFTAADLSTGYCSRFCEDDFDCPLSHHCDQASAGSMTVKVCFVGPHAAMCTTDDACPAGEHCNVPNGGCEADCVANVDCGDDTLRCDPRGYCIERVDTGGGGCCGAGGGDPKWLAIALAAWLARRRR